MSLRPKLRSFRVEAFSSENRSEGGDGAWEIQVNNTVEVTVAIPTSPGGVIQAEVKLTLNAAAQSEQQPAHTAAFKGEYVGRFFYPAEAAEADVSALITTEEHQYLLTAQVFPLAMSHFRREMLATGFDARSLPLGL